MNLYVGNLPYSMRQEELQEMFSEFGTVESARIISDRESGRSKGFGFVDMNDASEAKKAIDALNGKDINERKMVVNEARPREEKPRRSGGFNRDRSYGRDY